MRFHRLSQILQPKITIPPGKSRGADITSTSQKLLFDLGLVHSSSNGTYILLPFAIRAVEKVKKIIRAEMVDMCASEVHLPALTPLGLLESTGRSNLPELFCLKDRHGKSYVLSPTHEEAITKFVSSIEITEKHLPLLLYQMNSKFRDEIKPRFGMMRSREFLMKDLYCFERSPEKSFILYELVNEKYHQILKNLNVPYCCVEGCSGEIGGNVSHEFHILSKIGEDKILKCENCGFVQNIALSTNPSTCSKCKVSDITTNEAIEVGHSFLLGTRYSLPLHATYKTPERSLKSLEMSCHGIGVSRLLAAGVETLSTDSGIRWPKATAPYSVCIIPPKAGSKEEKTIISTHELYKILDGIYPDDVIIDDRTEWTIGKRLKEAKAMGYPLVLVIGKSSLLNVPLVEIHQVDHENFKEVTVTDVLSSLPNQLKT